MCCKIRYDEESCKLLGFWGHLNKALAIGHSSFEALYGYPPCHHPFKAMALFSSKIIYKMDTVALLFVFDKYYLIMD